MGGKRRHAKATIWTQAAVLFLQYGTRTGTIHRVGPRLLLGAAWYPMQAPQGREMNPCGLTALVKSRLGKQTWPSIVKYLVFLGSA